MPSISYDFEKYKIPAYSVFGGYIISIYITIAPQVSLAFTGSDESE
jgi:hypothetical protein